MDLFNYEPSYPNAPGWKDDDTSRAAAESMKPTAAYLQSKCLKALEAGPRSADQVASMINESILSIRPRMTELVAAGKIIDTGERRKNTSGRNAKVWRLA